MGVLKLRVALGVTVIAAAVACSLTYNWDPNGEPCREEGSGSALTYACDDGYSCLRQDGVAKTECVRDGSRKRDDPCSLDQMCEQGLECVGGSCRENCGANYFSTNECRPDEFCKPYPNVTKGYCTHSECLPGSNTCTTGRICAQLKDASGACLIECDPTFNDSQYADNCGSTDSQNFCQAVGQGLQRRLVCLDTNRGGQALGTFCNPIDSPCAADQSFTDSGGVVHNFGLTCVNGVCTELCDPTLPDPATNDTDCGASDARNANYCCSQLGVPNADGVNIQWGICVNFAGSGDSSQCTPSGY